MLIPDYDFKAIEARRQKKWAEEGALSCRTHDGDAPKYYCLMMFPYPSGTLHVGHGRNYIIGDAVARYKAMQGYNVLAPMGWDAFGLPAENAAIKKKVHPRLSTEQNIATIKKQLKQWGILYDWSREIGSCTPEYYRWTQWLFLQFHRAGLAYKKAAAVNWCPGCQTVLANEQVVDGRCERSGDIVEPRDLEQWFFRITAYAQRLLDDLDRLPHWPERVKTMQRNWIGRSEGCLIDFELVGACEGAPLLKHEDERPVDGVWRDPAVRVDDIAADLSAEREGAASRDQRSAGSISRNACSRGAEPQRIGTEGRRDTVSADTAPVKLRVYTTRPDTVHGVTFMSIAAEHPKLEALLAGVEEAKRREVLAFAVKVRAQSAMDREAEDRPKQGMFTGRTVKNPFTGDEVPLYVADYVLMYGTGIVMAVPAHDQRDFLFAKQHDLPIRVVIVPWQESPSDKGPCSESPPDKGDLGGLRSAEDAKKPPLPPVGPTSLSGGNRAEPDLSEEIIDAYARELRAAYVDDGVLVNSGRFDGMPNREAIAEITRCCEQEGRGGARVNYRLRDWLISRQRYWGCPIPIIYCPSCGPVEVPESDLPVLLPEDVEFLPTGESPLARHREFPHAACPRCGAKSRRETDTMDTFVCSSWYFLRFVNPRDEDHAFNREDVNRWLPVDQYIGGIEHAILHLMYARFFTKVLYDLGHVSFDEPFERLFTQGMICKKAYWHKGRGWITEEEAHQHGDDLPTGQAGGEIEVRMEKMSKSKLNVVSPDALIEEYGVDTQRLYTLFIGPPEKDAEWRDDAVLGPHRFLKSYWALTHEWLEAVRASTQPPSAPQGLPAEFAALRRKTHQTIAKVTRDLEGDFHFNTAIAAIMELFNVAKKVEAPTPDGSPEHRAVFREFLESATLLLSPFVPHIAEEIWEKLGHREGILCASWPVADETVAREDMVEVPVQISGKLRARISVPADADAEALEAAARAEPRVQDALAGKTVRKVVAVPGRMINFVV